jgi:hypothetical protein
VDVGGEDVAGGMPVNGGRGHGGKGHSYSKEHKYKCEA